MEEPGLLCLPVGPPLRWMSLFWASAVFLPFPPCVSGGGGHVLIATPCLKAGRLRGGGGTPKWNASLMGAQVRTDSSRFYFCLANFSLITSHHPPCCSHLFFCLSGLYLRYMYASTQSLARTCGPCVYGGRKSQLFPSRVVIVKEGDLGFPLKTHRAEHLFYNALPTGGEELVGGRRGV